MRVIKELTFTLGGRKCTIGYSVGIKTAIMMTVINGIVDYLRDDL